MGFEPLECLVASKRLITSSITLWGMSLLVSPFLTVSLIRSEAALPNTTKSMSEFEPNRLAPCTLTQAASPAAIKPSIGSSSPFTVVMTSP